VIGVVWIPVGFGDGRPDRKTDPLLPSAPLAVAVALLDSLGGSSRHKQVTRAASIRVANAANRLQVESAPGTADCSGCNPCAAYPGVEHALTVEFGQVEQLRATTGGTQQTTGPAWSSAFPNDYRSTYPDVISNLVSDDDGVLSRSKPPANYASRRGRHDHDRPAGLPDVRITADSVVDLTSADTLFQTVGRLPVRSRKHPPKPLFCWGGVFGIVPVAMGSDSSIRREDTARVVRPDPRDSIDNSCRATRRR